MARTFSPRPRCGGRPAAKSAPSDCAFVPELLDRLGAFDALRLTPDTAAALRRVSAATLKRLLAPIRATRPRRGLGITRAGTWLKHQIPIRTFADWDDACPGFLEGDLVAHCGPSTIGFYLCTLCAVDIVTGWTELEAVWGKGHERVGGAIHRARQRLPMPLLGWDSDSGSEFINEAFWRYGQRDGITFTRGRAYRKNDSATSSRRTAPSSGGGSAMLASPQARLWGPPGRLPGAAPGM